MATAAKKMDLATGRRLAEFVMADLEASCERIVIAGSIRRRRPEVSDIELCAIPKLSQGLFSEGADSLLDGALAGLVARGVLSRVKGGEKYRQYELPHHGCKLDLFICDRDTWGVNFTIRTGPAEFSKRLVTPRKHNGLLPSHLKVKAARIWSGDEALDTPEERAVFEVIGMDWIEPWERT
jgi:DNA polymerase/3'-5' exonuclease PolX